MELITRYGVKSAPGLFAVASQERLLPPLFWLITVGLVLAHQGAVLTMAFPAMATLIGLWLYFRGSARYIGFMWWLWFLSPEVRRLADWSIGVFTPVNPIQVAPLVVTMISAFTLLRHHRLLAQRRGLPVLLILLGLAYGFVIGVVSNGPLAAIYDLANWLYPPLIGFHIMANTRQYPAYRESIVDTFVWGMLAMGAYGLVQFFVMPPWDALWMLGSQMNSEGDPIPMGVRVFSTMNSTGPFALVMMGAMVFVTAADSRVRWIAAILGFLSLGLGMVRTAWGGWVIALLIQLLISSSKVRLRLVASAALVLGLGVPLVAMGPVADRLLERLQTIGNLTDDQSYQSRNEFYTAFSERAFTDMSGEGFGATGTATKLSNAGGELGKYGNFDSGVMNIPFVLGWPGTLLYLSGILWLLSRAVLASSRMRDDKFVSACLSLGLALFGTLVMANSLVGTGGLLLFMSLFLILSAEHWRKLNGRTSSIVYRGA